MITINTSTAGKFPLTVACAGDGTHMWIAFLKALKLSEPSIAATFAALRAIFQSNLKVTAPTRGMLRPLFHRMLGGHRASGSQSPSYGGEIGSQGPRRHFITCKFCQPSKLFPPMPLSDEQHRLPSGYRQQQVGSRRFEISSSGYLGPGRTRKRLMAALTARMPRSPPLGAWNFCCATLMTDGGYLNHLACWLNIESTMRMNAS